MRLCRRHGWVRASLQSGALSMTAAGQLEATFAGAERAERQSHTGHRNVGQGRGRDQDHGCAGRTRQLGLPAAPGEADEQGERGHRSAGAVRRRNARCVRTHRRSAVYAPRWRPPRRPRARPPRYRRSRTSAASPGRRPRTRLSGFRGPSLHPVRCAASAGRSGANGRKEFDAGAQGGGGQRDCTGDNLLFGVYEQVGANADIGEVVAEPAGAVDERQVGVSHHDQDVRVAGGKGAVRSYRTKQNDLGNRLMVTAQVPRRPPDPALQQVPVQPEHLHRTVGLLPNYRSRHTRPHR